MCGVQDACRPRTDMYNTPPLSILILGLIASVVNSSSGKLSTTQNQQYFVGGDKFKKKKNKGLEGYDALL